jgi:uncharacterized metal-binding protein
MAAATTHAGMRRKRRRDVTSQDTTTLPIATDRQWRFNFKQEESTKGLHSCFIPSFIRFQILYPEAMQRSVLTQQYFQKIETKNYMLIFQCSGLSQSL